MALMEVSIMYHVAIVLVFIWSLSYFNQCHPLVYFLSFIYLYLVHGRYVMRLKRKMQFFERKQSSQRRVLTDSESVRWLNHAVEKIWLICMEPIVSQKILLPIIPWFLEKYKPWTAKKALVQHLYMGRSSPLFTEMRVLHQPAGDDHLVLELGMNFLAADDMSAILAVKLRKRLGFGMWAKLHLTGMHVEGKVLVGVKFLRKWPFLGRIRLCFVEPPYFQMTVKPIFTHGVDVAVLPGIAGWLDKLLSIAFEQTLVEPNMLVVDMEKFVSPEQETWFHVDEKQAIAFAKVEVIEASEMKPSDLNGLADPYVKGQLGPYRVKTQIQKKTLSPKWLEEFMIPICTWESPNFLVIEVRDKDHFVDETLGDYTININDLRDGQRHDMWLSLQNIKMGRLHLAITVLDDCIPDSVQADDKTCEVATGNKVEKQNSTSDRTSQKGSVSPVSLEKSTKMSDKFEPINVEGQEETGIWVHQPGSEMAQTWEPRKGKGRRVDTQILSVPNDSFNSASSLTSGLLNKKSENADENRAIKSIQRGIRKITAVFQKGPEKEDLFNFEDHSGNLVENVHSPYANVRAINKKDVRVNFVVEEPLFGKEGSSSPEGSSPESRNKDHMKDMAKTIFKRAEKGARGLKYALYRKDSRRRLANSPVVTELETPLESNSSDDDSLPSPRVEKTAAVSNTVTCSFVDSDNHGIQESGMSVGAQTQNLIVQGLEKTDCKVSSP